MSDKEKQQITVAQIVTPCYSLFKRLDLCNCKDMQSLQLALINLCYNGPHARIARTVT